MKVKGSVVKSIDDYVKEKYPDGHKNWRSGLSDDSKKIYDKSIFATEWYPMQDGVITPTEVYSAMINKGANEIAWDGGEYSAEVALTGIYKVFVLIASPEFLMKRAKKILAAFYTPAEIEIVESDPKGMSIRITKITGKSGILENRMGGWMKKALETCGCKELDIQIVKAISKGDAYTEYTIKWI